jgi:hypothetical protein
MKIMTKRRRGEACRRLPQRAHSRSVCLRHQSERRKGIRILESSCVSPIIFADNVPSFDALQA